MTCFRQNKGRNCLPKKKKKYLNNFDDFVSAKKESSQDGGPF
jgi:hypothetical protein